MFDKAILVHAEDLELTRGAVIVKTKELIEFARHHGYGRDELIALMRRLSQAREPT